MHDVMPAAASTAHASCSGTGLCFVRCTATLNHQTTSNSCPLPPELDMEAVSIRFLYLHD